LHPDTWSSPRGQFARLAYFATCGSAATVLVSIAASQILLGIAIVAFLLSRQPLRIPRAGIALGLFLLGTLISLAASPDPRAGWPQVRKLYVYLMFPLACSVFRTTRQARILVLCCCAVASIGSALGLIQFARRWHEAHVLGQDFYDYYLNARITGFMNHWMTFTGEQMLMLMALTAFLLFGRWKGARSFVLIFSGVITISVALLLGDTRSTWIGASAGGIYLVWSRRKTLVLLVPVAAILAFAVAPPSFRHRAESIIHPQANVDSNDFRIICYRTGVRMIRAHPWLGLGPEIVHAQFVKWIPDDIPRPLPPAYYGHLHSIYLHYAAERGIPTMLALMAMLGILFWDFGRGLRSAPRPRSDARFLLHAGIACVIAILAEGFFELNLGDSEVLTLFLAIAAAGYAALNESPGVPEQESLVAAERA
jgi:O-antigen ligase